MAEKHLVKHWKGSRETYNFLKQNNRLDPWTKYSVIDDNPENGEQTIVEYLGANQIAPLTGQLLPVESVYETIDAIPAGDKIPYSRFLVGKNGKGYKIVTFTLDKDGNLCTEVSKFDYRFGVRIKDRMLKNYIYYESKLITYDDANCGEY
jgi:hypothetical protein